jgi:RNA polymerase primary sigma factor
MASNDKTDSGDAPLIDLNDASIKKLIARAKRRGHHHLRRAERGAASGPDVFRADRGHHGRDFEMGVNIVESDEDAVDPEDNQQEDVEDVDPVEDRPDIIKRKETVERTDDPVRMYLREMGAVNCSAAKAKSPSPSASRPAATMIMGLCESPITFHAIIQWSEALNAGEMQLREILDLDAMLSKEPQPENLSEDGEEADGEISEATAGPSFKDEDEVEEEEPADGDEDDELRERRARPVEEEEEDNTLSSPRWKRS